MRQNKNKMKSGIFFLCLFFFLNISIKAQYVTIPDANFRAYLQLNFPSCMNGNDLDTTCTGILNATSMDVQYLDISDLTGVTCFKNMKVLNCSHNQLTSLPSLPATLTSLNCIYNQLSSLPTLPDNLIDLVCYNNEIDSIPTLPLTLQVLWFGNNQVSSIPTLPSTLKALRCANNKISIIPVLPAGLENLECFTNQITDLPSLPSTLQILWCGDNQITTIPALPSTLTILRCARNKISTLPTLPDSLQFLECFDNQISIMPSLPSTLEYIYARTNQLTSLPALPSKLILLGVEQNQIISLPVLPDSLQQLSCYSNKLTVLPALPPSLLRLWCGGNQISVLPTLPSLLQFVDCNSNNIIKLPSLPGKLTYLNCSHNQLTSLTLLPLLLEHLDCNHNNITILPSLPFTLQKLICNHNQLQCLPYLPDTLTTLTAFAGNNIECIPNIPPHVAPSSYEGIPLCNENEAKRCSYFSSISGKSFYDANDNCKYDAGEIPLSSRVIQLDDVSYALTDDSGNYKLHIDTGSYILGQVPASELWNFTCTGIPYQMNIPEHYLSIEGKDFPNHALKNCPLLTVDIASSSTQHICFHGFYFVNYCNRGTLAVDSVYIDITFDSLTIPLYSSLPWSSVNGNTYHFEIGSLDVGQCGFFKIVDSISCSSPAHKTVCTNAEIFPHSTCTTPSTSWDKSSVKVTGSCKNNTPCFTIKNMGSDMQGPSEYRIYVDNILVFTGTFQLDENEEQEICWSANGLTVRLEADQRPFHPGHSHPRASVEMCGTGNFSTGQMTQVPLDDIDEFVEISCAELTSAFDPNEKSVIPSGIGAQNYIRAEDVLEYQIDFQNTGSDTAYKVEIVDTLDTRYLDLTTFESGVSSHTYTVNMYGNGIIVWTFKHIYLPDSNVDEAGSHGFVKFKINQVADNPVGTVINNAAAIYFDYNEAVITNNAFLTITDSVFSSKTQILFDHAVKIISYPNPFRDEITFSIKGCSNRQIHIEIYDALGKKVHSINSVKDQSTFIINCSDLEKGLYFYKVVAQGEIIGVGKMLKK